MTYSDECEQLGSARAWRSTLASGQEHLVTTCHQRSSVDSDASTMTAGNLEKIIAISSPEPGSFQPFNTGAKLLPDVAALRLNIVRGCENLNEIFADWSDLGRLNGSHYLHLPEWYVEASVLGLCSPKEAVFFAYYDGEQLVAVFPMHHKTRTVRRFGIPWRWRAWENYYPDDNSICDFTIHPRFQHPAMFDRLIADLTTENRSWQLVSLRNFSESGHALTLMSDDRAGTLLKNTHCSNYLSTTDSHENFLANYPGKFLRNLRRKDNKLQAMGEVRCSVLRAGSDDSAALERFLELEASGWKGTQGTAIIQHPERRAFYENLRAALAPDGRFGIHLLELDGRPIAGQLAIYTGRSIYLLKIGFDESLKSVSPGFLLVNQVLRFACEQPDIDRLSFVTGRAWMDVWQPAAEQIKTFHYFRFNLLSRIVNFFRPVNRADEPLSTDGDPDHGE